MKHCLTKEDIKLAKAIAYKRNKIVYNEETLNAAYYGLVKASNTYDKKRGTKFSTYAYRVINTTITDELNRMRLDLGNSHIWRVAKVGDRPELHSQVIDDKFFKTIPVEDKTEDNLAAKQNRNLVLKYLSRLPDEERKVLELRYGLNDNWRVYTRNEISLKLGLSISTVERREKRGIQRLRSWMKIDGGIDVYA